MEQARAGGTLGAQSDMSVGGNKCIVTINSSHS